MSPARVSQVYRVLFAALVAIYVAAGLAGGIFIDFERGADRAFWLLFLLGGAALMLAGALLLHGNAWVSAVAVSAGALVGALPLFWSVLVPIAAAAVVALTVVRARSVASP
ncbi:MAG TPA: hypothetical protein VNJ46_10770 [Gaiellaceae bacterium]|nr:hypothetical protein [Gaiellaceae bacterium]